MYVILILSILFLLLIIKYQTDISQGTPYLYSDFTNDIKSGQRISKIEIYSDTDLINQGRARVSFNDTSRSEIVIIPSINALMELIDVNMGMDNVVEIDTLAPDKSGQLWSMLLPVILMAVVISVLFFVFQKIQGNNNTHSKAMSFGKSKAKLITPDKNKVTFAQVAGLQEEKQELEEVAQFLREPKKYVDLGARIPKGILLVGPPGTGKTLLAKAVAGEASTPFFSISGSDFVEMYVGVGASRVRDLFAEAKKVAPCLIFIDEIDAVGRRRGAGLGGGHDEREQTLNQLLVEMDGFGINEGIIILAATNRADILDPALLRPGRFDRQVAVNRPDVKGREEILHVHAKGKKMDEDVDLKVVAQTTSGFTGADLENLLNESALISARENNKTVTMESIKKAFIKVGIGTEKKSRIVTEREKKITAYHEAGHAIIHEVLSELDPVHIISIIPTGHAGGYTMPIPSGDQMYHTKTFMKQQIMSLLAGRIAEDLILSEITTGASNDIERATKIARAMVTQYGMSDSLGPIQFGSDSHDVFLGKEISDSRNYGEEIATKIDNEVHSIISTAYRNVEEILKDNMDVLHKAADSLIKNEKISGQEFREMFPAGKLKEKDSLKNLADTFLTGELEVNN